MLKFENSAHFLTFFIDMYTSLMANMVLLGDWKLLSIFLFAESNKISFTVVIIKINLTITSKFRFVWSDSCLYILWTYRPQTENTTLKINFRNMKCPLTNFTLKKKLQCSLLINPFSFASAEIFQGGVKFV